MKKYRSCFHGIWGMIVLWLLACASSQQTSPQAKGGQAGSRPMLTGWLNEVELLRQVPAYQEEKNQYQPDAEALASLKNLAQDVQIIIFLGTWCSDSQREVPRFLKIMETIQTPQITFKMLALDRSKRDPDGVAEAHDIQFVPTFVVLRDDVEIGRIMEQPIVSIEHDLVDIFASIK